MVVFLPSIKAMRAIFTKLHARLGDFWWYSLTMFLASRVADVLKTS